LIVSWFRWFPWFSIFSIFSRFPCPLCSCKFCCGILWILWILHVYSNGFKKYNNKDVVWKWPNCQIIVYPKLDRMTFDRENDAAEWHSSDCGKFERGELDWTRANQFDPFTCSLNMYCLGVYHRLNWSISFLHSKFYILRFSKNENYS